MLQLQEKNFQMSGLEEFQEKFSMDISFSNVVISKNFPILFKLRKSYLISSYRTQFHFPSNQNFAKSPPKTNNHKKSS